MQEFRIKQEALKEIRKQSMRKTLPVLLIIMVIALAFSSLTSKDKGPDIYSLLIAAPLVGTILGFSFYRGLKRQQKLLESYTLTLTENMIMREQLNTPPISIYLGEVTEIVKNKNGMFMIRGTDKRDLICVPPQIEHYTQLEIELNQVKPVVAKTKDSFFYRFPYLPGLLVVGLMITIYSATNKIAVTLCGIVFIILAIWGFVKVQRSKNVNARTKRGMWWVFVLIASVIYVVISKLFNL